MNFTERDTIDFIFKSICETKWFLNVTTLKFSVPKKATKFEKKKTLTDAYSCMRYYFANFEMTITVQSY